MAPVPPSPRTGSRSTRVPTHQTAQGRGRGDGGPAAPESEGQTGEQLFPPAPAVTTTQTTGSACQRSVSWLLVMTIMPVALVTACLVVFTLLRWGDRPSRRRPAYHGRRGGGAAPAGRSWPCVRAPEARCLSGDPGKVDRRSAPSPGYCGSLRRTGRRLLRGRSADVPSEAETTLARSRVVAPGRVIRRRRRGEPLRLPGDAAGRPRHLPPARLLRGQQRRPVPVAGDPPDHPPPSATTRLRAGEPPFHPGGRGYPPQSGSRGDPR